jgi:hypothetical protein
MGDISYLEPGNINVVLAPQLRLFTAEHLVQSLATSREICGGTIYCSRFFSEFLRFSLANYFFAIVPNLPSTIP